MDISASMEGEDDGTGNIPGGQGGPDGDCADRRPVIVDVENEKKETRGPADRPRRRSTFDLPGNDLELGDLLLDAVLKNLEMLAAEIPDRLAFEKNPNGDFDDGDGDILLDLLLCGQA